MCRVFPSSLGLMPMRWFDGLRTNSISSFKKLTQSFCSRFITCNRVPQPLDSLLSMSMREGESVKAYSERYWDQEQGKGKAKVIPQERMDFRLDRYNNNRPRRDYAGQSGSTNTQAVNTVFRESVRQVLKKIKNEPFFKWPNKMAGDPAKRNQNLYCHYHQEHGHIMENCRNLWDHLDQLV